MRRKGDMSMNIVRVSIEKLFGQFDYTIKLNEKEGITVLTGPNGYGKTTILNIIYSLFTGSSLYTNYAKATLFFSDGSVLDSSKDREAIKNVIPVYFIKDRRLTYSTAEKRDRIFKRDGAEVLNRIDLFSKKLIELIAQIKSREDTLALDLARTFPTRLLKYNRPLPQDVFEKRFETLSTKQKRLQSYGITPGIFTKPAYEGENRRILSLYLEDYERITSLYDDLLARVDLFLSIMDSKWLVHKTFTINADRGFCFTGIDGKPLATGCLSSGEQQEIILLYEPLFNAPPHSLVLIDNPEVSMHVAWQIEFLHDIERIANLLGLSFIVATHSPGLINDKFDWCLDLSDLARGKDTMMMTMNNGSNPQKTRTAQEACHANPAMSDALQARSRCQSIGD
jgi:predicted ATP-dependent endonuclease of OLD family